MLATSIDWESIPWAEVSGLAVINFIGMFGNALTGFAENIVFQIGWYMMSLAHMSSGSLLQAGAILTLTSIPLMSSQAYMQRQHLNIALGATIGTTASLSSILGVYILVGHDNDATKRWLGIVLLAVFFWRCVIEGRFHYPPPTNRFEVLTRYHFPAVVLCGLASGILGGLFSTPGHPSMVLVLMANIGKDEWRSSSCISQVVHSLVRMGALTLLDDGKIQFDKLWLQSSVSLLCGLVGLFAGNKLAPYVSEANFRKLLMIALLLGGLVLLTANTGMLTLWVLLGAGAAILAHTFLPSIFLQRVSIVSAPYDKCDVQPSQEDTHSVTPEKLGNCELGESDAM